MRRINLLPQSKQTELYYEDLYVGVTVAAILGVAALLLGVLAQVGVLVYLQRKEVSVIAQVADLQQQLDRSENAMLKQEIRQMNTVMADFESLATNSPRWSGVLKTFARLVPNGVLVSTLTADTATGEIVIAGYAPTREQVIELYNNINADKQNFKDINYPLENVARPTDVQFNFKFYIQDGVLTSKTP